MNCRWKNWDESKRKKANCIQCSRYMAIKANDMCPNCWSKYRAEHEPLFYLRRIYAQIRNRCSDPGHRSAKSYYGKSFCPRAVFLCRFGDDPEFLRLYKQWQLSGFSHSLSPSVDRINNQEGYTLENMQIMTLGENSCKDKKQALDVFTARGVLVFHFDSQTEAANALNLHQANIGKVVRGERRTTGGYIFKPSERKE